MPGVMAMQRELRRVPLDFDFPRGKTWPGFLTPRELDLPQCPDCGGMGYSPLALQMDRTFYALDLPNGPAREAVRWDNKLTQDDVDHLVEERRLGIVVKDDSERGWHQEFPPVKLDELEKYLSPFGHDGINRWLLVKRRCRALGTDSYCATCGGDGNVATPEQRAGLEAWTPTEPPTGEGFQLWQTVSEGGPCSPVFDTVEGLAEWLAANDKSITSHLTYDDWMGHLTGERRVAGTELGTGEPISG